MVIIVTMATFGWQILSISEQILSWMMDEFICWPKPYLVMLATRDKILLWVLEIWMKNHLVSDSVRNTVNL